MSLATSVWSFISLAPVVLEMKISRLGVGPLLARPSLFYIKSVILWHSLSIPQQNQGLISNNSLKFIPFPVYSHPEKYTMTNEFFR